MASTFETVNDADIFAATTDQINSLNNILNPSNIIPHNNHSPINTLNLNDNILLSTLNGNNVNNDNNYSSNNDSESKEMNPDANIYVANLPMFCYIVNIY